MKKNLWLLAIAQGLFLTNNVIFIAINGLVLVDPSHTYNLITAEDLVNRGLAAKARSNCILASPRLAELGITLRPIDVALRDAMEQYAVAKRNS